MPKEAFAWLARYNRANRFAYQRLADGRSRTYDDTRNRRSEGTDRRSQGNGDERQKTARTQPLRHLFLPSQTDE